MSHEIMRKNDFTFASGHVIVIMSGPFGCSIGSLNIAAGKDNNEPMIETASVLGAWKNTESVCISR